MFYFISNKKSFNILHLSIRHFWRVEVLVLQFWNASVFYDTYNLLRWASVFMERTDYTKHMDDKQHSKFFSNS